MQFVPFWFYAIFSSKKLFFPLELKIRNKWFKMSQSCIDNSALNERHFPCVEVGAEYIQNFFYDKKKW